MSQLDFDDARRSHEDMLTLLQPTLWLSLGAF